MSFIKKITKCAVALTSIAMLSAPADAAVYPKGTFSVTPINMNLSSLHNGFRNQDTKITTLAAPDPMNPNFLVPFTNELDLYRSRFSAGFHESDRHGFGYAAEASYFVQDGLAVLLRAGFSHESGFKDVATASRGLDVKSRTNYGAAMGLRKFFDVHKKWRPYVAGIVGFTRQGAIEAGVKTGDSFSGVTGNPVFVEAVFLNKKTLYVFEFNVGAEYMLSERCALRFETGIRYGTRGGTGPTINTQTGGGPVIPLTLKDNRQQFTFPINLGISFIF